MGAGDAGYDFIQKYSNKEVNELYKDRIDYAKKYLKELKLEEALGMIEDAAYYSSILKERGINHEGVDYEIIRKDLCNLLFQVL